MSGHESAGEQHPLAQRAGVAWCGPWILRRDRVRGRTTATGAPRTTSAGARRLHRRLTFRSRLGHVVISLAERTTRSTAGEPRVETAGVEGMTAGETTDVVVILDAVQTNRTGVSRRRQQLRWDGRLRVVIFFLFLVVSVG